MLWRVHICVTSRSNNSCPEEPGGEPFHCVCVRVHNTVCLKNRCVAGASSGLLISMHGMSVEARGPETGTSSYCGPIPRISAPSKSEEMRGEDEKKSNLIILALSCRSRLTLIRQLILHHILLHASTPALHPLRLRLQQLEEPAAVGGAHRSADGLQGLRLWLRHTVHPRVRRGQDWRVELHLPRVVSGAGVVVVPRALDADRGGGSVAGKLPRHGGKVPRAKLRAVWGVVEVSLHRRGDAVGAGHPAVTRRGSRNTLFFAIDYTHIVW